LAVSGSTGDLEKKVLNYVKTYKDKGYSAKDIRAGLQKSGVDDATISQALKAAGVGSGSALPLILTVSVVLVLLIGGAIAAVVYYGGPECESDRDCGSGYECSRNECVVEEDDVQCTRDSDCGSGYECSRNACVYVPQNNEPEEVIEEVEENDYECDYDADCGDGFLCVSNYCEVDDSSYGAEAQCGDGDCNIGEDCPLDCGCIEDSECTVYGDFWCDEDTYTCESLSGSSGGDDSSTPRPDLDITDILLTSLTSSEATFDIVVVNSGEDDTEGTFIQESILSYKNTSGAYINVSDVNITAGPIDGGSATETQSMAHNVAEIYDVLSSQDNVTVRLVAAVDTQNEIGEHSNDDNSETYEKLWTLTTFGEEAEVEVSESCESDSDCEVGYGCNLDSGDCEVKGVTGPRCSDGVDNDGDGLVDYPYDRGCFSIYDDDERMACSDGIDNDNDGQIDMDDSGCTSPADKSEKRRYARCNDGIDNDGDGLKDIMDPDCVSKYDDDERDHGLGAWFFSFDFEDSFPESFDFSYLAPGTEEFKQLSPLMKFKALFKQ
jgi:hypothetical protein